MTDTYSAILVCNKSCVHFIHTGQESSQGTEIAGEIEGTCRKRDDQAPDCNCTEINAVSDEGSVPGACQKDTDAGRESGYAKAAPT
jgi:hypothetical protein